MNKIARILTLLICCSGASFLAGELVTIKAQQATPTTSQPTQRKRPLTFKQVESLIKGTPTAKATPDNIVAQEIEDRLVDFQIDDQMLARLEEMGAGQQTLNALRSLRNRVASPGKTIVLLADFKGLNGEEIGLTDILSDKLTEATANYQDVKVVPLGEFLTATRGGRTVALDRGREHNASIVLWGWFVRSSEKILVTVNFEVIRSPHSMAIFSEKGDYRAALSTLNEFTLQGELSNELTTIVLATTGLARMDVKDYWGAVNRLNEALNKRVSPQMVMGYDDIFLYSSIAYILAIAQDGPQSVNKNMPQVVKNLEEFTKINNQNATGFHLLGLAHILTGEFDKALADGRKILELESEPVIQAAAYQILFYAAQIKGDQKQEIEYAKKIVKNYENLELPFAFDALRADAYISLGDEKRALDIYDMDLKRDADAETQIRIHRAKAAIYSEKKETWNQALEELKRITQLDPQDADAYNRMGNIFYWRQEYTVALAYYDKAINLAPKNAIFYDNRGNTYDALNNINEALLNYKRSLEIDPNYSHTYFDRGSMLYKLRNLKDALRDFNKCLELDPKNIDALYWRASINIDNENLDAAISDYKKIIEIEPDNAEAYNRMADVYYWRKEYTTAISFYNTAIRLDPKNAMFYDNLGNVYRAIEPINLKEALANYQQAIEVDPKYAITYLDRSYLYKNQGQLDKALIDLSKCLQLDPKNIDALYAQADIYVSNGDFDAAISDYKKIMEITPNDATPYFFRGITFNNKGFADKALEDFTAAIKLNPSNPEVYLQRGLLYATKGDAQKAKYDLSKVLQISKDPKLREQAEQQLKQLPAK
jgi:tetratricopeptide (TPR) repeat protein